MSDNNEIGGYFELPMPYHNNYPNANGILVNSCRCALEYVLRSLGDVKRVFVPYYTCSVVLEPLKRLSIPYTFYHIDDNLRIKGTLSPQKKEYILYTNYFGIMDSYLNELASQYKENLIVDNAQALFSTPLKGVPTVYSPRKFVGIPDGGIVCNVDKLKETLPEDYSSERSSHLLKRWEIGAEGGYSAFKKNDVSLSGMPLKKMSRLTQRILESINFNSIKAQRTINFELLRKKLYSINLLKIEPLPTASPLAFPLRTKHIHLRKILINERVFTPTYWPNIFDWCVDGDIELDLANEIIPLPIDQRYGKFQMQRIFDIIEQTLK